MHLVTYIGWFGQAGEEDPCNVEFPFIKFFVTGKQICTATTEPSYRSQSEIVCPLVFFLKK